MRAQTPLGERQILDDALQALRDQNLTAELDQEQPQMGDARADALVRIGYGEQQKLYVVQVTRWLTQATVGPIAAKLRDLGTAGLLVTEYANPQVAEQLTRLGIAYADTAGNINLRGPNFLVRTTGRKQRQTTHQLRPHRAFRPAGLKVIFALLCDPRNAAIGYRELAAYAGVANGTVGWVMADLQQLGYLHDLGGKRGTRRLFNLKRLLTHWAEAYALALRPRTLIGRYYIPTLQGWKNWPLAEHNALWGGEPAAAIMTDDLRPGELTIYADKLPTVLAAQQKFLRNPEAGHAVVVEVREKFWNFPPNLAHPGIAPPVLVYADLLATGDARCIETAKAIYDSHLARLLPDG